MALKFLEKMHQDQKDLIMNLKNTKMMLMKVKILYLLMKLVNQLMTTFHGHQDKEIPVMMLLTNKK